MAYILDVSIRNILHGKWGLTPTPIRTITSISAARLSLQASPPALDRNTAGLEYLLLRPTHSANRHIPIGAHS